MLFRAVTARPLGPAYPQLLPAAAIGTAEVLGAPLGRRDSLQYLPTINETTPILSEAKTLHLSSSLSTGICIGLRVARAAELNSISQDEFLIFLF